MTGPQEHDLRNIAPVFVSPRQVPEDVTGCFNAKPLEKHGVFWADPFNELHFGIQLAPGHLYS
jgi:hypothetical protein